MPYHVRCALIRALSPSFSKALQQHQPMTPIDVKRALEQHEAYTEALRSCVDEVIVMAADDQHPDCCFIEDTAIAIGHDLVIARIGAASRRNESEAVYRTLQELQQRLPQLRIHRLTEPATLDGGDVLQMGERIFVGISQRTNREAARQLEKLFPGRVISVPVAAGLHLKSVLSAWDHRTLIVAADPAARAMAQLILEGLASVSETPPRSIEVADPAASNVVRAGQNVLIQQGFPDSEKTLRLLAEDSGLKIISLNMSELIKADGALTCCSILLLEA